MARTKPENAQAVICQAMQYPEGKQGPISMQLRKGFTGVSADLIPKSDIY